MKKIINYIFVSLFSIAIMASCNGNNPQDPNDNGNNGNGTEQNGDNGDGDKEPEVEIPNFKQQKWTDFHKELITKWKITTFLPEPENDVLTYELQAATDTWPSGYYVVTFQVGTGAAQAYINQLYNLSKDNASGWTEETRIVDEDNNPVPAFTNSKDYIVTYGGVEQSIEWIGVYHFADTQK